MQPRLVPLVQFVNNALIDIRYATTNNFTGKRLYSAAFQPQLTQPAAEALGHAADYFSTLDLRLVIWDAYRPVAIQNELLSIMGGGNYVRVDSNHPKGLAVDATLTNKTMYLDMGTDYDDFSSKAHSDAGGLTEQQYRNRELLMSGMKEYGFTVWPYEWWHFDFAHRS